MNRFIRRHGITRFHSNPFFPVNTLMMMRGAIAAGSLGSFERYVDEMYRHMWVEPKKMDDPAIFQTALVEGGFEADRILSLLDTQEIKQELIRNTERSVERGTFGSPTFYVGNEIFFGKDRLSEVEEAIKTKLMSRRVDERRPYSARAEGTLVILRSPAFTARSIQAVATVSMRSDNSRSLTAGRALEARPCHRGK